MSYSEEYKEHIEYAFAAFCKIIPRNAALSAYRDIGRKQERETSLEYLMEKKYYKPSTTDKYFEEQPTVFVVCGEIIAFENRTVDKGISRPIRIAAGGFGTVLLFPIL